MRSRSGFGGSTWFEGVDDHAGRPCDDDLGNARRSARRGASRGEPRVTNRFRSAALRPIIVERLARLLPCSLASSAVELAAFAYSLGASKQRIRVAPELYCSFFVLNLPAIAGRNEARDSSENLVTRGGLNVAGSTVCPSTTIADLGHSSCLVNQG